MSVYTDLGYTSRQAYLESLAEAYNVDLHLVLRAAIMLGPRQDFKALVHTVKVLPVRSK